MHRRGTKEPDTFYRNTKARRGQAGRRRRHLDRQAVERLEAVETLADAEALANEAAAEPPMGRRRR